MSCGTLCDWCVEGIYKDGFSDSAVFHLQDSLKMP